VARKAILPVLNGLIGGHIEPARRHFRPPSASWAGRLHRAGDLDPQREKTISFTSNRRGHGIGIGESSGDAVSPPGSRAIPPRRWPLRPRRSIEGSTLTTFLLDMWEKFSHGFSAPWPGHELPDEWVCRDVSSPRTRVRSMDGSEAAGREVSGTVGDCLRFPAARQLPPANSAGAIG